MCKCIEDINKRANGTKFNGITIRRAIFMQPRIRLRFYSSSKTKDFGVAVNYCPFCGESQKTEKPEMQQELQQELNHKNTFNYCSL